MKSFKHFYPWIFVDSLDAPGADGKLTIRGRAPSEVPDKIARWLMRRKVKKQLNYLFSPTVKKPLTSS